MSCFDEDQGAEVTISAADFAVMQDELARLESENARLTALLAPPTIMTAEEVTEPGLYRFKQAGGTHWDWGYLADRDDRSYILLGTQYSASKTGEAIGPIKMPEAQS